MCSTPQDSEQRVLFRPRQLMDQLSSNVSWSADAYYSTINKEAPKLFEVKEIDIEVLHARPRTSSLGTGEKISTELDFAHVLHTSRVRTLDQLNSHFKLKSNAEGHVVFLIPQRFSWGRLQITPEAFERIRLEKRISPSILHILRQFGSKTYDKLPRTCSFQSDRLDKQTHTYELCYINRFIEQNGRNQGDSWSLRQTGVYQKIDFDTGYSSCVILLPSESIRKRLGDIIADCVSGRTGQGAQMIQLHLLIITSTAANWSEYIEHLHSIVETVNEKACFSDVENATTHDYVITFADVQRLHILRGKILKTSLVLNSCLELADRLGAFCLQLGAQNLLQGASNITASIELYIADIRNHQRNTAVVLQALDSTTALLLEILKYRNNKTSSIVNDIKTKTLDQLKDITADAAEEGKRANTLATNTQKDSLSVKALTTVATGLLPATLLATICSSSLVERQNSANGKESRMVFAKQIWIYVLLSLGATALTWLFVKLLERRWLRDKCSRESV